MKNTISDRAMLVGLSIKSWGATAKDKKVSAEVAQQHNSDSTMGRYSKNLIAKECLASIRAIESQARTEHYFRTLPWSDDGYRILSSGGYMDYTTKMREFKESYTSELAKFIAEYDRFKAEAKVKLNGLFNEADYPAITEIARKFDFTVNIRPVPQGEDFRVSVGDAEAARIRREIEANTQDTIKHAMDDVWHRLKDVVEKMKERLAAYKVEDGKVVSTFRDSLVTNISDLVDIIPTLNITGDPKLTEFSKLVKESLTAFSGDQLRSSEHLRKNVEARADEIFSRMSSFLG